jgi:hypothetical protein
VSVLNYRLLMQIFVIVYISENIEVLKYKRFNKLIDAYDMIRSVLCVHFVLLLKGTHNFILTFIV